MTDPDSPPGPPSALLVVGSEAQRVAHLVTELSPWISTVGLEVIPLVLGTPERCVLANTNPYGVIVQVDGGGALAQAVCSALRRAVVLDAPLLALSSGPSGDVASILSQGVVDDCVDRRTHPSEVLARLSAQRRRRVILGC